MSKANPLGGGLTREIVGERLRIADTQRKIQAKFDSLHAPTVTPVATTAKRKALTFKPKMPGVTKRAVAEASAPGTKRKLVMKVSIKSPALRRVLGVKSAA